MDQVEVPARGLRLPDIDVLVPRAHNLRGSVEPRCPECGNPFQPHKVLYDYRYGRPRCPSCGSFATCTGTRFTSGIYRRYNSAAVRGEYGCTVPCCSCRWWPQGGTCCSTPRSVQAQPVPLVNAVDDAVHSATATCLHLCGFCLLHEVLCAIGLAARPPRQAHRAKDVVGYGLAGSLPCCWEPFSRVVMAGPCL